MKAVEKAAKACIKAMGVDVASSPLAAAVIDLSRRLDAGPGDRSAVDLTHELRMTLVELRRQAAEHGTDDVERFLERIAAPELGHTPN